MIIFVEKNQLQEQLVPATSEELDKLRTQAKDDPKLRRQLTLPLRSVPQYQFLFTRSQKDMISSSTLIDVLEFLIVHEKKYRIQFSKGGDKFIGFIAYSEEGGRITGGKMASFFNDQEKASSVIIKDLRIFIDKEMKTHKSIEWEAFLDNPLNKIYQSIVPQWFPNYGFSYGKNTKEGVWLYRVFKK